MIRFLAIVIGAGVAGVTVLAFILGGGNDGPAYEPAPIRLAPKPPQITLRDEHSARSMQIREEVSLRFPGAPAPILDIAIGIADPGIPLASYSEDILALDPEEVNAPYGQPFPGSLPDYVHTLLREAVMSGNTGAAALLLDRGADVTYNDNEMAFQAVNLSSKGGDADLWFPDYRSGSKLLRIWIARGGDVNLTHPLYGGGTGDLLFHTPHDNLEGILALLDAGADPWRNFAVRAEDGGFLYEIPGYFLSLANDDRIHNEVAFRIALEGHYKNGPETASAAITHAYERAATQYRDPESEEDFGTVWTLQKTIRLLYEEMDKPYGPEIQRLMKIHVPREIGGFFLAPGQIRSPSAASQRAIDRTRFGGERWLVWPRPDEK